MGLDLLDRGADADPGCGPRRTAPEAAAPPLRLQIYEAVRGAGRISRASLAKDLKVSPGSVTPLVSDLLRAGLLREVGGEAAPAGRGRPPVTLAVAARAASVAGFRATDREVSGALIDLAGRTLATARAPRGADPSAGAVVAAVAALLARLRAAAPDAPAVVGAGLGLPGMVDHDRGLLCWSPVLRDRDVALAARLSDRLSLPVAVDNDANLLTMAELWFGRGRDLADFAVVTIDDGVGMGLVAGHALQRGAHGMGLELGHAKVQIDGALCRCGARGCLEAYVADYALVREAAVALSGPLPPRGEVLAALRAQAAAGNDAARAIFDRAGRYLALGLANVANLFDPSRIILSGSRLGADWPSAGAMLAEMAALTLNPPPPVEINAWDDTVWARGAAALALGLAAPRLVA